MAGPLLNSCKNKTSSSTHDKPNIVFIFIDDLGWKDVGYMGSKYYETPTIDRLAKQGMIFTQAYANAANCAPTRASLFWLDPPLCYFQWVLTSYFLIFP